MTDPVLILTMKWGTLYGTADVNRLARQVRRHLARPHRFICFTDDATGIGKGVETLPLPELGLPAGHGDTRWEDIFRMLNHIGYTGPISVEWEDAGMDRLQGAPEALAFLKRFDFSPSDTSFDAAFSQ